LHVRVAGVARPVDTRQNKPHRRGSGTLKRKSAVCCQHLLWAGTERAVGPDPGDVPVWAEVAGALVVGAARPVSAAGVGAVGQGRARETGDEHGEQLRHHGSRFGVVWRSKAGVHEREWGWTFVRAGFPLGGSVLVRER